MSKTAREVLIALIGAFAGVATAGIGAWATVASAHEQTDSAESALIDLNTKLLALMSEFVRQGNAAAAKEVDKTLEHAEGSLPAAARKELRPLRTQLTDLVRRPVPAPASREAFERFDRDLKEAASRVKALTARKQ